MSPLREKVNVKPVYLHLVHRSAYEGPCRVGELDSLTPEADTRAGAAAFERFATEMRQGIDPAYARVLPPAMLTWHDDFVLRREEWEKLLADEGETDLYLFDGFLHQFPAVELARRYRTPVGIVGHNAGVDGVAHLRARGYDAFAFVKGYGPEARLDIVQLNDTIRLLRVKKALARTNALVALKNDVISKGVQSNLYDLEDISSRLGMCFTYVNAEQILDSTVSLSEEPEKRARAIAKSLDTGALKNRMSMDDLLPSVRFYVAVEDALRQYECNAFTVPCFEICATRALQDRVKATPCLTHSLLKDQGVASACEADLNVLLAMSLLMNLAGKAPHMGNTNVDDMDNGVVSIGHDVVSLKMKGYQAEDIPYEIRGFTARGWGATLRYDFNRDKGSVITAARMDPSGSKAMVVRGEILSGHGHDTRGCSQALTIRLNDARGFFEKQQDVGHHFAWVYGDYTHDMVRLCRLLKLDAVVAD